MKKPLRRIVAETAAFTLVTVAGAFGIGMLAHEHRLAVWLLILLCPAWSLFITNILLPFYLNNGVLRTRIALQIADARFRRSVYLLAFGM